MFACGRVFLIRSPIGAVTASKIATVIPLGNIPASSRFRRDLARYVTNWDPKFCDVSEIFTRKSGELTGIVERYKPELIDPAKEKRRSEY
jgi:hypothetical protein